MEAPRVDSRFLIVQDLLSLLRSPECDDEALGSFLWTFKLVATYEPSLDDDSDD